MTLEEPVEYNLPWIRQAEIKDLPGRSFGDGIRSILRQDPDIILVGEIRDNDAATMALRASMTGHTVYTTLHAPDSIGVLPRLVDLGLSSTQVCGILKSSISQRLVRLLCPKCKAHNKASKLVLESYTNSPKGCEYCNFKGYRGRTALSEVLIIDEEIEELIFNNAPRRKIKESAKALGFKSMKDDARLKISDGVISPEEVQRVLGESWHEI
jgi:general secretion pathway protein E/type IV pilus assembly protein PilB